MAYTKRDSLLDGAKGDPADLILKKYKTAEGFYDTLIAAATFMDLDRLSRHVTRKEPHIYVREEGGYSASYIPVKGEGDIVVLKRILDERLKKHSLSYEVSYVAALEEGEFEYKTLADAVRHLSTVRLVEHLCGKKVYLFEIHCDMHGHPIRRINVFCEDAKDFIREELHTRKGLKLVPYITQDEEELYFLTRHLRDFPLTDSISVVRISIDPSVQSLTTFMATRDYLSSLNLTLYGDVEDAYRRLLSVHHIINAEVDALREIKHKLSPPGFFHRKGGKFFKHTTGSMKPAIDSEEVRWLRESVWDELKDLRSVEYHRMVMEERWKERHLPELSSLEGGIDLSDLITTKGGDTPPP